MIKPASLIGTPAVALLIAGVSSLALAGTALAASPAPAASYDVPSIYDGFVSLAVGGANVTGDYGDGYNYASNGFALEGAASGEYDFNSTLGFQGDLVVRSQDYSIDGYSINERDADVALHGFYRLQNQFLLGAFAQYGLNTFNHGDFGDYAYNHYMAGAEGQYFIGDFTLYGQVGAQQLGDGAYDSTGIFGTLEARYFLTPNFKIEGHIGGENATNSHYTYETVSALRAGIGAEYKFEDNPFSIFAKYDFAQFKQTDHPDYSVTDNRILVGVKFNFGTTTLEDRDRSGASLKPVETVIPGYYHASPTF